MSWVLKKGLLSRATSDRVVSVQCHVPNAQSLNNPAERLLEARRAGRREQKVLLQL